MCQVTIILKMIFSLSNMRPPFSKIDSKAALGHEYLLFDTLPQRVTCRLWRILFVRRSGIN